MAVIGLGHFPKEYRISGGRLISRGWKSFEEIVKCLREGELVISGKLTQTEVVEDEDHYNNLVERGDDSFYAIKDGPGFIELMTVGNSRMNFMELSILMDQKAGEGKFGYVKKPTSGIERRRG